MTKMTTMKTTNVDYIQRAYKYELTVVRYRRHIKRAGKGHSEWFKSFCFSSALLYYYLWFLFVRSVYDMKTKIYLD